MPFDFDLLLELFPDDDCPTDQLRPETRARKLTDPMTQLLSGHSCSYPYNIDSAYVQSKYDMDLASVPQVVDLSWLMGGCKSTRSQKMILPVGRLSSALDPAYCWSRVDSPSPCHFVIPTHETYFFSGASTLSLTSHSFPRPGPHRRADPSLDPEIRSGISGEGAHSVRTSDA